MQRLTIWLLNRVISLQMSDSTTSLTAQNLAPIFRSSPFHCLTSMQGSVSIHRIRTDYMSCNGLTLPFVWLHSVYLILHYITAHDQISRHFYMHARNWNENMHYDYSIVWSCRGAFPLWFGLVLFCLPNLFYMLFRPSLTKRNYRRDCFIPRGWSLEKFRTRFRNLGISLKISGKISRFHVRFQDFQKDYARFPDFNEDFCKISRFQWRFLQRFPDSSADFDILIPNFRMMMYCIHADWHIALVPKQMSQTFYVANRW